MERYFPDLIRDVAEFKAIAAAENPEIDNMGGAAERVLANQFVKTAEVYGIGRLEKILKITPKGTDTLDERRFRILSKLNVFVPYTWNALGSILDGLCGENRYERERYPERFAVIVRVGLGNRKKFEAIKNMLEDIIPSNMQLDVNILYLRHWEAGRYRHRGLSRNTHFDIRERRLDVFTEHRRLAKERQREIYANSNLYIREEMHKN